jgi:hypothetical protein
MTTLIMQAAPFVEFVTPTIRSLYQQFLHTLNAIAEAKLRNTEPERQLRKVRRQIKRNAASSVTVTQAALLSSTGTTLAAASDWPKSNKGALTWSCSFMPLECSWSGLLREQSVSARSCATRSLKRAGPGPRWRRSCSKADTACLRKTTTTSRSSTD